MPLTTPPTAPTHHTEPAQALAQVQRLYQQQIDHLRAAMQRFVAGDLLHEPVRAFYPFVRVHTTTVARADSTLAYGFVEGPPGRYETTLTRSSFGCCAKTTAWSSKWVSARTPFPSISHLPSTTTSRARSAPSGAC